MTAPVAGLGRRVAVLYQAAHPPVVGGAAKPMKVGGYTDSGADLAFALRGRGVEVVTPVAAPDAAEAPGWVWPDTREGIAACVARGATVLWANTVLFAGHPLDGLDAPVSVVGHRCAAVERADDKLGTNAMLREHGLAASAAFVIVADDMGDGGGEGELRLGDLTAEGVEELGFRFPLVIKPIRGRGSQGVQVVAGMEELRAAADGLLRATTVGGRPLYGLRVMVEEYLPGEEMTVAVMPGGWYAMGGKRRWMDGHWALPPVRRMDHQGGIAPYSGLVAVARNSAVLGVEEAGAEPVRRVVEACARAAALVDARAVIRIDCRMAWGGEYRIFDLNMKPNMTGPGRPGREDQASLVVMAAAAVGWDYGGLLLNLLDQAWPLRG